MSDLTLPVAVLLVFLIIATVTDIARHKIYNWTTYPGIVAGFVTNAATDGWTGLEDSLLGFGICGLIMLLCFVLFNVGGGDLKLIAMMGAGLGLYRGIEAMLWTFVIGSIMGVALLVWRIGILHILKKSWQHLRLIMRARSWVPPTEQEREPLRRWLFLAPAALVAVGILIARDLWVK